MSDRGSTRRRYLKTVGAVGAIGVSSVSGCLGNLGGGGGPIPMGSILPLTGQLGQYGGGMQEAVELAVQDINDAGGPLGREIELSTRNSETDPNIAAQRYDSLVSEQDIVGFVGAASSGVSVTIAENIASDQVMQVSNASTSPVLAEMGYNEDQSVKYFGRTAPNDGQQGLVMGRILNNYIEADTAAFLYVNNAYGEGLANKAEEAFDGETLQKVGYADQTTDYTSTLNELHEGDPDGIGFVGYPGNGRTIVRQWAEGGYGTSQEDWVLSEGLNSDSFINNNSSQVGNMYMASPNPRDTPGSSAFQNKIGDANTLFAAHAYDAMFLQGLAMHAAGEASGTAIAENIRAMSRQGNTTITVGEFGDAKEALDNDANINYEGASSPVDMNASLEPLNPFSILRLTPGEDQIREELESIDLDWFQGRL